MPVRAIAAALVAVLVLGAAVAGGLALLGDDGPDRSRSAPLDTNPGAWPVITDGGDWRVVEASGPGFESPEHRLVYDGELDGRPVRVTLSHVRDRVSGVDLADAGDERVGTWRVAGREARVWTWDAPDGSGYHLLTGDRGGSYVEVYAAEPGPEGDVATSEWRRLLGSVRLASQGDAEAAMGPRILRPSQEAGVLRTALDGVPLPSDLTERQVFRNVDARALTGTGFTDFVPRREAWGAVARVVVCGWKGQYRNGSGAERERAERVLLGVERWPLWDRLDRLQQAVVRTTVRQRDRRFAGACA